ncbi:MAG TPA: DUF3617 domain-containing protein [Usitatibacter sp.]|jgi:hypothetical protein|nr:DUF3617 domain-containing protein [Usitatibacter sp.]
MRAAPFAAAALAAAACCPNVLAGPFDGLKSHMKAGMYEYKMDMDMSQMQGMPPGMGKQSHTFQHCVTAEDIDKGQMGRAGRDGKAAPENCEVKNMQITGDSATYTMACKQPHEMTADNKIIFRGDGYTMDMKMAMNQAGHPMNMTQHLEARYLGPCSK